MAISSITVTLATWPAVSGSKNGCVGAAVSSDRTRVPAAASSMISDSQNGNAPPPGPSPSTQPIGSTVACHMK